MRHDHESGSYVFDDKAEVAAFAATLVDVRRVVNVDAETVVNSIQPPVPYKRTNAISLMAIKIIDKLSSEHSEYRMPANETTSTALLFARIIAKTRKSLSERMTLRATEQLSEDYTPFSYS